MASRKEVADLAGVSEATVSRVLNGVGPIKEETRRKVLEASEQLGYVPALLLAVLPEVKAGTLAWYYLMFRRHICSRRIFLGNVEWDWKQSQRQ